MHSGWGGVGYLLTLFETFYEVAMTFDIRFVLFFLWCCHIGDP